MSAEDIQTITRIVVNQNCAILEARISAIEGLLKIHSNHELAIELAITLGQLDRYHIARARQAKQQDS